MKNFQIILLFLITNALKIHSTKPAKVQNNSSRMSSPPKSINSEGPLAIRFQPRRPNSTSKDGKHALHLPPTTPSRVRPTVSAKKLQSSQKAINAQILKDSEVLKKGNSAITANEDLFKTREAQTTIPEVRLMANDASRGQGARAPIAEIKKSQTSNWQRLRQSELSQDK